MPSVDVIIVSWNAGKQLTDCLTSLKGAACISVKLNRVMIVDNASKDDSISALTNKNLLLQIIRNTENRGFAAACNQGAQRSSSDYLGIHLVDDSGKVSRTCARFPMPGRFYAKMFALDRFFPKTFPAHFMAEWDHSESRDVDQVMGAFFLVRRSLFEELGGFDERFFLYFEEVDFTLRARKAGYRSYYFAEAQAYHKGGGTSEQIKAKRLFYSLRSRILYCYKHFEWASATTVLLGTLFIEPFSRIAYAAMGFSGKAIVETLKGYAVLWKDSPNWVRKLTAKT